MSVEHLGARGEIALLHEVDQALHRFPFIDGIGDHAFQPRAEADRFLGLLGGNAIGRIGAILDQHDVVGDDVLAELCSEELVFSCDTGGLMA